jgi:hypothetical protein
VEAVALVISVLSLLVAAAALIRTERRWKAERERDVLVLAWHYGGGVDIGPPRETIRHVVAVRVSNHGERTEHVMWLGIETPSREPIDTDRPETPKTLDRSAPEARELPPRGQLGAQFEVPLAAIA